VTLDHFVNCSKIVDYIEKTDAGQFVICNTTKCHFMTDL